MLDVSSSPVRLLLSNFFFVGRRLLVAHLELLLLLRRLNLLVAQLLGHLLVLKLLRFQLFRLSLRLLLFHDLVVLLVFVRFVPFDDFELSDVRRRGLVQKLTFHDVVNLVVSSLVLVHLLRLLVVNVGKNGLGLEVLGLVGCRSPVSELFLAQLVFVLDLPQFLFPLEVVLPFLLVLSLHLLELLLPFFCHSLHPVPIFHLVFGENRVDFGCLSLGLTASLRLHFFSLVVVDVKLVAGGVPDRLKELSVLLNGLLVLFNSIGPLLLLFMLHIFVLFHAFLHDSSFVFFEFL